MSYCRNSPDCYWETEGCLRPKEEVKVIPPKTGGSWPESVRKVPRTAKEIAARHLCKELSTCKCDSCIDFKISVDKDKDSELIPLDYLTAWD